MRTFDCLTFFSSCGCHYCLGNYAKYISVICTVKILPETKFEHVLNYMYVYISIFPLSVCLSTHIYIYIILYSL